MKRKQMIEQIIDVDKANYSEIFGDLLRKGFKGYENMSDKEIEKIYTEYYGKPETEAEKVKRTGRY